LRTNDFFPAQLVGIYFAVENYKYTDEYESTGIGEGSLN